MKIYVIGIGPGDEKYLTFQAKAAIEESSAIVGYDVYVKLIEHLTLGKILVSTGMKKERERCMAALELAKSGNTVSLISSGDAGVYGMAGLIFEVSEGENIEIEVIPGITAACSAAAILGAPLTGDFAVISLSDLLTPWEKIEKRLFLASEADFVICLYNPSSKKRQDYLAKAVKIMKGKKPGETPCGYVKNIGRNGQSTHFCTLNKLENESVDMFSTIIIGNSMTKMIEGKMITPRGYSL